MTSQIGIIQRYANLNFVIPAARRSLPYRLVALLVLASFWTLGHPASDDACATGVFPAHDESQHAIGAADEAAPDHCAVCHSVRSPRRPFDAAGRLSSPLVAGGVVDPSAADPHRSPARAGLPARAPPVSLS